MASRLIEFRVGVEKRKFMMHSAVVAVQSPALNTLVNGNFSEAQTNVVEWPEVDEETFACFWQYAYTGDYGNIRGTGPGQLEAPTAAPDTTSNDGNPNKKRKSSRIVGSHDPSGNSTGHGNSYPTLLNHFRPPPLPMFLRRQLDQFVHRPIPLLKNGWETSSGS